MPLVFFAIRTFENTIAGKSRCELLDRTEEKSTISSLPKKTCLSEKLVCDDLNAVVSYK